VSRVFCRLWVVMMVIVLLVNVMWLMVSVGCCGVFMFVVIG